VIKKCHYFTGSSEGQFELTPVRGYQIHYHFGNHSKAKIVSVPFVRTLRLDFDSTIIIKIDSHSPTVIDVIKNDVRFFLEGK